ncbi:MAG TPA: type II secretion system F family protein [Alphaproteobacteria bacterium]
MIDQIPLSGVETVLIFGAIVLGVLLTVDGLYSFAASGRRRAQGRVNRRLDMLARGADPKAVLALLRRIPSEQSLWLQRLGAFLPVAWLSRQLAQAGMTISLARIFLVMTALALAVFAALAFGLRQSPIVALPVALTSGFMLPVLFILRQKRRRLARFAEQLPDAVDMLVRSLRVGHPLAAAMGLVAEEMPDPIGTEFGIAVDEMTYGLDVQEAIANMGRRLPVPDLQYLVVAVNVQYGTGGNLAEVLDGLSRVVRARFRMHRRILSVSAEGRLAAKFLTAFPFVVVGAIWLMRPDYYLKTADHPLFTVLAIIGAILVIMNSVIMKWLTNIKV